MTELFTQALPLKSGLLYNVSASLLVSLLSLYIGHLLLFKIRRTPENQSFAFFLVFIGLYWLLHALGNLAGWAGYSLLIRSLDYFLKPLSILPLLALSYYLTFNLTKQGKSLTALYIILGLAYILLSLLSPHHFLQNYWGVQWGLQFWPSLLYLAMLVPLMLFSAGGLLKSLGNRQDLSLYLAIIIYFIVDSANALSSAADWPLLLVRLAYLAVAGVIYLRFAEAEIIEEKFVSAGETIQKQLRRRPIFLKLLWLFILVGLLPLIISSFLIYFTFWEIIDLYVNQPLLFGLKASREEFLNALNHARVQVYFLISLTVGLVLWAAVLVSCSIAESLRRIGVGMKRISGGDFSFKIKRESDDELGDLINYFNDMSAEVKRARDVLSDWNQKLDAEVKEKTRELRGAYDQLVSLDKLKTDFMSNISHELRTPLTNVENHTALIFDGLLGSITEEMKKSLATIRQANQRELSLVNRLLNFSASESGKFFLERTPQHIHELVNEALKAVEHQTAGKQAEIKLNLSAQNDRIATNREKFVFCLADILDNALKFNEGKPLIEISTKNTKDQIEITISDNGIGVGKELLEKIFDKFYQADASWTRKYGGTGMGLALAKKIVEAHEGKIWAESEGEGRGMKIIIRLPVVFS